MNQVALDRTQLATTLDLLAREQARLHRHPLWFHLHRAMVFIFVGSIAIVLVAYVLPDLKTPRLVDSHPILLVVPLGLAASSAVATIPLLLINLSFAWRLWRHNRLQRRLGLTPAQRDQIRRSIRRRPLTGLLAVAGSLLSLPLLAFVIATAIELTKATELGLQLGVLLIGLTSISMALSFPALWLISRSRDRHREITRLREQLAREAESGEGSEASLVSTEDYDHLARLEKQQAVEALNRSLHEGRKATRAQLYAIQRSLDFHAAIEQLQSDTRSTVDRVLFDLMTDPRPSQAQRLAASSLLSIPVPDSSLELLYEPDDDARRLRIHSLQFASRAGERHE